MFNSQKVLTPNSTLFRFYFFAISFFLFNSISGQNFSDVSLAVGITESFGNGYAGGGISMVDFNEDGFIDITFGTEEGKEITFYQSNAGLSFTKISLGITDTAHQRQILWVDVDNDNDLDLYVSGYHAANKLYLNDGQLNFTDVSSTSGIVQEADDSYGAIFGDIDLDGDLDLYISNHYFFPSRLYLNDGLGQFTNITATSGISDTASLNFCSAFFDYDQDGDLDLYKINDKTYQNEFYENNGDLTFTDIGSSTNADIQIDGMAIAIADINNNGLLDLYMSNTHRLPSQGNLIPGNVMLKNKYPEGFEDISASSGANYREWCWGSSFADFDNDGYQDIYTSNIGVTYVNNLDNQLYFNNGDERFIPQAAGNMIGDSDLSHSCSVADFNNDGKMDIFVGNIGTVNSKLWQNNIPTSDTYLQVKLEGTTSNTNGVGSWIKVYAGDQTFTRFTHCGIGYLSQESHKNHFGLGANTVLDSLVVKWPSGLIDKIVNPPVNECINIIEGTNNYTVISNPVESQPTQITDSANSVARNWMELLLESIRNDYARPTVHARNLFHSSIAMYDAWAAFQNTSIQYMLGQTQNGYHTPYTSPISSSSPQDAQEEAISFAMFRLLSHRFQNSPGGIAMQSHYNQYMIDLGYNIANTSIDYSSGDPAALGNYIAHHLIQFGLQDGSNEQNGYSNTYYEPVNDPLVMNYSGNPNITELDRWQPLTLDVFIDQSGNSIPINTPDFLSPEWGNVTPFALQDIDKTTFSRAGNEYLVYCDPGPPPFSTIGASDNYRWGFSLVSAWSSHLDSNDPTMWDISPASLGNISSLPNSADDYPSFYNLISGGDSSVGHVINPATNAPYIPQMVKRADYTRVLAEFWADGPDSETPPGHWFALLNHVSDHPSFEKKFQGSGANLNDLEWDVKAYFSLGGPMHDAAISAWSIKGWYDYIRPVSAIRAYADQGQSSDPSLPAYNPEGLELIPGLIELIGINDSLVGSSNEHLNKIKVFAWRGPDYIPNPETSEAGVGWIRAEDWWPYQRPSFVTPPFAGYVSGHSTYSRAAAEVLTALTGDPFFPGGMGEFVAEKDAFLVFENGPSDDVVLQWATYRDASDQCSLSRIWGGIHPPADDIPGRIIGEKIGVQGFNKARHYILGTICGNVTFVLDDPIPYSLYKANKIYSSGMVLDPHVSFEASDFIELLPGFEVALNAQFRAIITGCP